MSVLAAILVYANWSVRRQADAELAQFEKSGDRSVGASGFMLVEDADGTRLLIDKSSGKVVRGPLIFRDDDGGVLAVRDKAAVRLSGDPLQNIAIWIIGPMRAN